MTKFALRLAEEQIATLREALSESANQKAELLEALETYINIPVMADPGHEQELIGAINNAQTTIRRARDETK